MIRSEEEAEALVDLVRHYGLPVLLSEIDDIIANVTKGILSVPLDKDPDKMARILLQERYKMEGAIAVKNALLQKIRAIKEKK